MRADQLLVCRGLADSRSQAQRLIADGVQWRRGQIWQLVRKNGDQVPPQAQLHLLDAAQLRYVSRGGLKLEAALRRSGLSVLGLHCLDVGQGTGGFSDCLLQHGAASVVGLEVGCDQLHPRLRQEPRLRWVEGVNVRYLQPAHLQPAGVVVAPAFALMVLDLSFISQTLVLPALLPWLQEGGWLLSLVKPQFELQPEHIGKGGIVKDASLYAQVEQRLRLACLDLGLTVEHWFDSALTGGDGNREFFLCARRGSAD